VPPYGSQWAPSAKFCPPWLKPPVTSLVLMRENLWERARSRKEGWYFSSFTGEQLSQLWISVYMAVYGITFQGDDHVLKFEKSVKIKQCNGVTTSAWEQHHCMSKFPHSCSTNYALKGLRSNSRKTDAENVGKRAENETYCDLLRLFITANFWLHHTWPGPEFFLRKMWGTRYGSLGTRFLSL